MKTALCIGINDYPGTDSDLSGCVNDVKDWASVLSDRGFSVATLLNREATGQAIRRATGDIVSAAEPKDTVVIQYSGHGTRVPDLSHDEEDGYDEGIVPVDPHNGVILDDEVWQLFKRKKPGVRLILISDSCHSGTVVRRFGGFRKGKARFMGWQPQFAKTQPTGKKKGDKAFQDKSPWPCLLMAGCQDYEYSYDASFNGRPNGAFTRAAIDTLKKMPPKSTYRQWFLEIRKLLPSSQHPQKPRLIGSYINTEIF
jgi:hypothetical protein